MADMTPAELGVPRGCVRVDVGEVYVDVGRQELVILGSPADGEESGLPEDEWHNCDAMGCGQSHVLVRLSLLLKERRALGVDDG